MRLELQSTSYDVWKQKYQLKDSNGDPVDSDINDTYSRVAKELASVEVDPNYWEDEFKWALNNGATPAGRILSNAGAKEHKPATSLINCLAGDTKVLTRDGLIAIRDLAGKDVEVLNGNSDWVTAPFKSFGEQDVYELTFKYGDNKSTTSIVKATKDHRWFMEDGTVITTEFWLTSGVKRKGFRTIPHLFVPKEEVNQQEYDKGLIHGLVYGDGSRIKQCKSQYYLNLCSEKMEMTESVGKILGKKPKYYESIKGSRFTVDSEVKLKELPETLDYSYLKGFYAGVLATDGSITSKKESGCEVVLCGDSKLIAWVKETSAYLGINYTYSRKCAGRGELTNLGVRKQDLWVIGLHPTTVPDSLVIRTRHKTNFSKTKNGFNKSKKWTIVSINKVPTREEVYCCHEKETTSFCILNGMKTGQCTVSEIVEDDMAGIMRAASQAAVTLKSGCGIGYEFSTLRPKGAYVAGAGAHTSGPLSFMDIFDSMCFTVSSAGGRRGK